MRDGCRDGLDAWGGNAGVNLGLRIGEEKGVDGRWGSEKIGIGDDRTSAQTGEFENL